MNYLSVTNSPFDNLVHIANDTASTTEAYAENIKKLNDKKLHIISKICEITAIALIALGIFVAAWINIFTGLITISLSFFPLAILKYQIDKQTVLLSNLEKASDDMDFIIEEISSDLKVRRMHKEETIIEALNSHHPLYHQINHGHAYNLLKTLATQYDNETMIFTKSIDATCCHEYTKAMPFVQLILNHNPPGTINLAKWNKIQKACFLYLYGKGGIKTTSHSGTLRSKFEPFVKLEMDEKDRWMASSY